MLCIQGPCAEAKGSRSVTRELGFGLAFHPWILSEARGLHVEVNGGANLDMKYSASFRYNRCRIVAGLPCIVFTAQSCMRL
jgi:hypothetical protein